MNRPSPIVLVPVIVPQDFTKRTLGYLRSRLFSHSDLLSTSNGQSSITRTTTRTSTIRRGQEMLARIVAMLKSRQWFTCIGIGFWASWLAKKNT
jgi:hypothetical protein